MTAGVDPNDYVISRKRKKYRFALFHNSPLCFEHEEWDTSWNPDVIEVGAGTGLFSVEQAKLHPEKRFLAVDVKGDRLQKGAREAESHGLTNIRFLRTRADRIGEIVPKNTVDTIWVTFPDPFPKKRSASRRLTHPYYLAIYQSLLKESGSMLFKTDARELFTWSLERLVESGWCIAKLSFDLHESNLFDDYKLMTTYEQRWIGEGASIGFVAATPPNI